MSLSILRYFMYTQGTYSSGLFPGPSVGRLELTSKVGWKDPGSTVRQLASFPGMYVCLPRISRLQRKEGNCSGRKDAGQTKIFESSWEAGVMTRRFPEDWTLASGRGAEGPGLRNGP